MEHPFKGQKYINFLEKQQEKANRKLVRAIRDGKIAAANEAAALVAAIDAELSPLKNMTFSLKVTTDLQTGRRRVGGAPGRAHGGPVEAGRSYIVGERGRETFVPEEKGYILSIYLWVSV